MYDDIGGLFPLHRYDEPGWDDHDVAYADQRLRVLVYVDGRLVETLTDAVRGTRWEVHARRFEDELRPAPPPALPPRPVHARVLDWLHGLVGGPDALDALTDDVPETEPPTFADDQDAGAYLAVADHLDRVAALFFDEEIAQVLQRALATLWVRDPSVVRGPAPAQQTAGGLCWVVGRANGLFGGGLTQTTLQRELWLKTSLSTVGQRVARVLKGIDLYGGHRPHQAPDLVGFANPALLTPATRRLLIRWRDQARAAERAMIQDQILPSEVDSSPCPP